MRTPHRPLAIDLFCGLGGWTEGLLAEGWRVVGFDVERHVYGNERYPAQLVLQDVLTIHGAQFASADLIVASPPCQEYSYMAMPWSRAKQKLREYEDGTRDRALWTALFDACFRIQREACHAAGRHIPMVVENVRGAQRWVGQALWHYGSYYLWGDVPALMPHSRRARKVPGFRFDGSGRSFQSEAVKVTTMGAGWYPPGHPKHVRGLAFNTHAERGLKIGGDWFSDPSSTCRRHGSKSRARKHASATIAKIPTVLSRHIAATYHPRYAETAREEGVA